MAPGQNVDKSQITFKSRIAKLCEPLIQIQDVSSAERRNIICTLAHSSVREFLVNNPRVLSDTPGPKAYPVDSTVLATVCLNYLYQQRYSSLLRRNKDTFVDANEEDFMDHRLLSYAAKYWDKHLDGVSFSQDMCAKVEAFVTSSQFWTCLQVQSLVIEGQ